MGFIAEIHLAHESLVLLPTIRFLDDSILEGESFVHLNDRKLFFFSVFGDVPTNFTEAVSSDHTIDDVTAILPFNDRTVFRGRVTTDLDFVDRYLVEHGGYVIKMMGDGKGWLVRAYLPDRDSLVAARERCLEDDIMFQIVRLSDAETIDHIDKAILHDQQRDILLTALYLGYFDVPRQASQRDLADELDVSTSAISQRLRRAIAQLIIGSLHPEVDNRPYE